ncbi:hypothetical protein ACFSHP_09955 [Novosphingobium panipatense]
MESLYEELLAGLHSVWHRRWIALGIAWAVCLVGWLAVALIPNSYRSRARIFIQLDDALAEQVGIGVADKKRDIERIRQTLTSAVNLEKVVRSTRLGDTIDNPKAMEAAVLRLAKNVKVVTQEDNLFEITATANDSSFSDAENAKLAQNVAQKLIDLFREENLSGNRGDMVETLEFVNQQLRQRERELEAAETKRVAFEAQHPEMALGGAALAQRLETSRASLRDIDADLSAARSACCHRRAACRYAAHDLGGAADGGAQSAFARAQADLSAMRARGLTENHPDVIAARNQAAALRAAAAQEAASGGEHPTRLTLRSSRSGLNARLPCRPCNPARQPRSPISHRSPRPRSPTPNWRRRRSASTATTMFFASNTTSFCRIARNCACAVK